MSATEYFAQLQDSALGQFITGSAIVFPWLESVHVLAITFVVGSIAVVDLRLLGWASSRDTVARMNREIVPWTLGAFVLAAITGSLLFVSAAERYFVNGFFRTKMILMLCAGINMLVFHLLTGRHAEQWPPGGRTPFSGRLAGGLSLVGVEALDDLGLLAHAGVQQLAAGTRFAKKAVAQKGFVRAVAHGA